jgi:hypothetical protein
MRKGTGALSLIAMTHLTILRVALNETEQAIIEPSRIPGTTNINRNTISHHSLPTII